MSPVMSAVIVVGAIGLVCGVVLSVVSEIMKVKKDEKAEKIEAVLPGANCGACGYSGCSGYAAALSAGETDKTNLCMPGGDAVAAKIAEITGMAAGTIEPVYACVHCNGTCENSVRKLEYEGVMTCAMASQVSGGPKACHFGCIGLGDCVKVCPYDAISIKDGIACINPVRCRSCGLCIKECPKKLIEYRPAQRMTAAVMCNNKDKGAVARKECKAACIGCMRCTKECPTGAITVNNFNAHVDIASCTGCSKCAEVCPVGCIKMCEPFIIPASEIEAAAALT